MLKSNIVGGFLLFVCVVSASAQSLNTYCPINRTSGHGQRLTRPEVFTPQMIANDLRTQQVDTLDKSGAIALQAGDNSGAEDQYRKAIALDEGYTPSYEGLAQALIPQGRAVEAIQVYRKIFYDMSLRGLQSDDPAKTLAFRTEIYQDPVAHGGSGSGSLEDGLCYALLLNETGQWAEVVRVYESALPLLPGGSLPKIDIHFDPTIPQPVELEAAANICLGLSANFFANRLGDFDNVRAFTEYTKALQLKPEWPLANYYYSLGWQHLDEDEQAKFGTIQQAKAALQKAVKLGKGEVKTAAQRALQVAMKPK